MAGPAIVDYSFSRPPPQSIKNAGYLGVARYISWDGNPKNFSVAEKTSIESAGLAWVTVWETVAQEASTTAYAGGQRAAGAANKWIDTLGIPDGATIYFVLEDPNRIPVSLWPKVFAYCDGLHNVLNPKVWVGGYGSQNLLEEATREGKIFRGWQVGGWSTGVSPVCHLYQRLGYVLGNTCDEDAVLNNDWGQTPRPNSNAPTTPVEDDVQHLWLAQGDGPSPGVGDLWVLTDQVTATKIKNPAQAKRFIFREIAAGNKVDFNKDDAGNFVPVQPKWPQEDIDALIGQ